MGLLLIKLGSVEIRPRPLWNSLIQSASLVFLCFVLFFTCFFFGGGPMLSITDQLHPHFKSSPAPLAIVSSAPSPLSPVLFIHPFIPISVLSLLSFLVSSSRTIKSFSSSSLSSILSLLAVSLFTFSVVFLSFHVFRLSVTSNEWNQKKLLNRPRPFPPKYGLPNDIIHL